MDEVAAVWVAESPAYVLDATTRVLFTQLCRYLGTILYNAQLWQLFHERVMEALAGFAQNHQTRQQELDQLVEAAPVADEANADHQSRLMRLEIDRVLEQERAAALANLFHSITHDLMTPITTMKTGLFLLSRFVPSDDGQARLHMIEGQLDQLTAKLHNLIFMAQLDAGEYREPVLQATNLNDIVTAALNAARNALPDAQQQVELVLKHGSLNLTTDGYLLQRALQNLIDNALRYTRPADTIRIVVQQAADSVEIIIEDDGPGIAADDLTHLFERMYRSEKARTGTVQTGLGLPIAREIIVRLHGEITLMSEPGHGTTATVSLPLRP